MTRLVSWIFKAVEITLRSLPSYYPSTSRTVYFAPWHDLVSEDSNSIYPVFHFWEEGAGAGLTWTLKENLSTVPQPMPLGLAPAIEAQMPVNHMIASHSPMTHQEAPSVNTTVAVHQHNHHTHRRCDRCSGIWCTYLECIVSASINREDDQKQTQLQTSYDDLRLHIHEHSLNSFAKCSLCEDLFFHHILQRQLLFSVDSAEMAQVRIAVGTNIMYLRMHVEEAHGRF